MSFPMALTQPQHVFLQALMARSVMREDTARSMHAEITGADPAQDPRAFDRFWGEIARAIGFLDLDLRRVKWPEDDQLYVGVVNKRAGETAKLATRLTAEQIALFRMVLDEILRDDRNAEHGVDVISALNATQLWSQRDAGSAGPSQANGGLSQAQTQSVAKMSKVEKEATLKTLCEDGWLKQGDDEAGRLRLGVRSFLELKDFLLEQAPERARERWERIM